MLWDIDKQEVVTRTPHQAFYNARISHLSQAQIQAIQDEIVQRIDGDEVAVAGFIPGSDWTGTPFQSIYEVACDHDRDASRRLFGILVWVTLMEHEDFWGFMRDVVVNNAPVDSMTYFRVDPQ